MSNSYLDQENKIEFTDLESKMHAYAKENKVPIIKDEGLALLRHVVAIKQPKKILEIGTAIGFSAINMARFCDAQIDSLEINPEMEEKAISYVNESGFQNRIHLHLEDGLTFETEEVYDLIFIDGPKAQYIKFFERYEKNLSKGGVVFTDNLMFHGLVMEEIQSRQLRQLVNKIKNFNDYITSKEAYLSYIYDIGDGICISIKK